MRPAEVTNRLLARKGIMTKTPYGRSFALLAPRILTMPENIDKTLREIRALAPGRTLPRSNDKPLEIDHIRRRS